MSKKAIVTSQKVLNTRGGMFYRIESSSFDIPKNRKNLTMYYEK